ncbi:MAG: purine-nucleoside phosphorylase [Solirubrobacterales bacterium]
MTPLEDIELPEGDGETIHLNPAAEFQPRVLLPGDPARAMAIATAQLTQPRMFNHRRGLWGYSGETDAGVGFLIQATGMGGPSAAIVCEELADLGAEVFVRVGTCGAIDPNVKLGDLIVARAAIGDDGTSKALGVGNGLGISGLIEADAALAGLLAQEAGASGHRFHDGAIGTVDLFYDPDSDARHQTLIERGALAIEMEAAAVFAVGARRAVPSACLLAVTDELWDQGERKRLTHDEIAELGEALGAVAVAAVSQF